MEKEVEQSNSKASKKRVVVESLGWITESSIMPKKRRVIEGVGPSSIFELKAQLYKSLDESKRQSKEPIHSTDHQYGHHLEVHRTKKKISAYDPFSQKNSESYNKRVRGELFDEEDSEKYYVDFFHEGIEHDEPQLPQGHDSNAHEVRDEAGDYDDIVPNMKVTGLGQATATVDRSEHKHFVMEVHEEVNQARKNIFQLEIHRQEQIATRREKLKQAYLRK
ncbi:Cytochrome b561/ferric reductase transmembrane protein family [Abeliophyllum distichum]|uniref:Cytochrome b561/ferric reductase transmembrane protein family n=1 Tax=Abeliophyllum distichum TaxID=126358 RepID=A0ABD1PTM2_9LAMI